MKTMTTHQVTDGRLCVCVGDTPICHWEWNGDHPTNKEKNRSLLPSSSASSSSIDNWNYLFQRFNYYFLWSRLRLSQGHQLKGKKRKEKNFPNLKTTIEFINNNLNMPPMETVNFHYLLMMMMMIANRSISIHHFNIVRSINSCWSQINNLYFLCVCS